jgi:accessory gene regulator protein AgrB
MKINHKLIFAHALRTAMLFVAGFLIYDILINLEKKWKKENQENNIYYLYKKHTFRLILTFIMDLLILYGIVLFLDVKL